MNLIISAVTCFFVSIAVVANYFVTCDQIPYNPSEPYQLVWEENFNTSTELNYSRFGFEVGFIRNNELQFYRNSTTNVYITPQKTLMIEAFNNTPVYSPTTDGNKFITNITSGSIETTETFVYGRFEMRAKVPTAKNGSWPAFWLLGIARDDDRGWPWIGELDIMENVGYEPDILHGTIHDPTNNGWRGNMLGNTTLVPDMNTRWATYSIEWDPFKVLFFVDSIQYFQFYNDGKCQNGTWPYYRPMRVKINLAVGGSWGGLWGLDPNLFPIKYEIEYVRIYQQKNTAPPPNQLQCNVNNYYMHFETSPSFLNFAEGRDLIFVNNPVLMENFQKSLNDVIFTAFFDGMKDDNEKLANPSNEKWYANVTYVSAISPSIFTVTTASTANGPRVSFKILVNFTIVDVGADQFNAKLKAKAVNFMKASGIALLNTQIFDAIIIPSRPTEKISLVAASVDVVDFANLPRDQFLPYYSSNSPSSTPAAGSAETPSLPFGNFSDPTSFSATFYDFGGPYVGYNDVTVWNENNDNHANYQRAGLDWVDISLIGSKDGVNVYGVAFIYPGEWLSYSLINMVPNISSAIDNNTGTMKALRTNFSVEYAYGATDGSSGIVGVEFRLLKRFLLDSAQQQTLTENYSYEFDLQLPVTGSWTNYKNSSNENVVRRMNQTSFSVPSGILLEYPGIYRLTIKFKTGLNLKSIALESEWWTMNHSSSNNNNNIDNNNTTDNGMSPATKHAIIIGCCVGAGVVVAAIIYVNYLSKKRSLGGNDVGSKYDNLDDASNKNDEKQRLANTNNNNNDGQSGLNYGNHQV